MPDWGQAMSVAMSGLISVFAVLFILMIAVQVTGAVIGSFAKKKENS